MRHCTQSTLCSLALTTKACREPAQIQLFSIIEYDPGRRSRFTRDFNEDYHVRSYIYIYDAPALLWTLESNMKLRSYIKIISIVLSSESLFASDPIMESSYENGESFTRHTTVFRLLDLLAPQGCGPQADVKVSLQVYTDTALDENDARRLTEGTFRVDTLYIQGTSDATFLMGYYTLISMVLAMCPQKLCINDAAHRIITLYAQMSDFFPSVVHLTLESAIPPDEDMCYMLQNLTCLTSFRLECEVNYDAGRMTYDSSSNNFSSTDLITAIHSQKDRLHEFYFSASYEGKSEPSDIVGRAFQEFTALQNLRMPIDFLMQLQTEDDDDEDDDIQRIPIETMFPPSLQFLTIQTNPSLEWYTFDETSWAMKEDETHYKASTESLQIFDWLQGIPKHAAECFPNLKKVHITTMDNAVLAKCCPVEDLKPAKDLIAMFARCGVELSMY